MECANSSAVSLTVLAGCLANFHSLFLIMVWFVFIQSESSSFTTVQGSVVAGFAKECWVGRTVSHGLLPEEGIAVTGVGGVQETFSFRREDAIMHRSTLPHLLLLLQCVWGSWDKKKNNVSSKEAYSTSRGTELILCSLYLQYFPEVEGLETGTKSPVSACGCSFPERIFAGLLQLPDAWPTIFTAVQFFLDELNTPAADTILFN